MLVKIGINTGLKTLVLDIINFQLHLQNHFKRVPFLLLQHAHELSQHPLPTKPPNSASRSVEVNDSISDNQRPTIKQSKSNFDLPFFGKEEHQGHR